MPAQSSFQVNCPICGAGGPIKFDLFSCDNCGLRAKLSAGIYSTDFQKDSVGYPEDGSSNTLEVEDTSFWFAHRHLVITGTINNFFVDGYCLDIGGGNGFEAQKLQGLFTKTTLIEPSYLGCIAAQERGVKNIIQGTLDSLQLNSNRIAAACFFDVLEHLHHPQEILNQVYKILKPGGRVYVTVPAFNFLWSDEDDYAQHKRRYSRKTLINELRSAGFEIDFISYYFAALLLPIFVFRTLPSKFGSRKVENMNKSEHSAEGFIQKILNFILKMEAQMIAKGWRLPFGSSLICVARKPEVKS